MRLEELKYPIGPFVPDPEANPSQIQDYFDVIERFPEGIRGVTEPLRATELNWRYRPDGWNIMQVVHHCADSHMNAFIRFKLTLTEDHPTIRPYFEDRWTQHVDANNPDLSPSYSILDGVHHRWTQLNRSLAADDLKRTYNHPEYNRSYTLLEALQNYVWHCHHHLAHIHQALEAKGKYN